MPFNPVFFVVLYMQNTTITLVLQFSLKIFLLFKINCLLTKRLQNILIVVCW